MWLTKTWKTYQFGTIIALKGPKTAPQTTKAWLSPFRHPTALTWTSSTKKRQSSSSADSIQVAKTIARHPKQWKILTISKSMLRLEDKVWLMKILKSTKLMLPIELKNEIRKILKIMQSCNRRIKQWLLVKIKAKQELIIRVQTFRPNSQTKAKDIRAWCSTNNLGISTDRPMDRLTPSPISHRTLPSTLTSWSSSHTEATTHQASTLSTATPLVVPQDGRATALSHRSRACSPGRPKRRRMECQEHWITRMQAILRSLPSPNIHPLRHLRGSLTHTTRDHTLHSPSSWTCCPRSTTAMAISMCLSIMANTRTLMD